MQFDWADREGSETASRIASHLVNEDAPEGHWPQSERGEGTQPLGRGRGIDDHRAHMPADEERAQSLRVGFDLAEKGGEERVAIPVRRDIWDW